MPKNNIKKYQKQPIRTVWDERKGEWLFSVVDIIRILTEQPTQRGATFYWSKLKERLATEGAEQLLTNCQQLKIIAEDGKKRLTDVMNTEQVLRLVQSVPSKKAEPFKIWLAKVGRERIDETIDPEQAIDRALDTYLKKGYSEEWVHQRLLSIRVRNDLTDEWRRRGVKKGVEYAILTDEISKAWSGMTTKKYKEYKGLKKENLRDHMTDLELVLTMLSEATTTEISRIEKPEGFIANKDVAKRGGMVAGNARREIESQTGQPVITGDSAENLMPGLVNDLLVGEEDDELEE